MEIDSLSFYENEHKIMSSLDIMPSLVEIFEAYIKDLVYELKESRTEMYNKPDYFLK